MKRIILSLFCIVTLLSEFAVAQNIAVIQIAVTQKEEHKPQPRSVIPPICKVEYNMTDNEILIRMFINDGFVAVEIMDNCSNIIQTENLDLSEQSLIIITLPQEFTGKHRIEVNTAHFKGVGYLNAQSRL